MSVNATLHIFMHNSHISILYKQVRNNALIMLNQQNLLKPLAIVRDSVYNKTEVSTMRYLSVRETAEKWNIAPRRVQVLCNENRIDGVQKAGNSWIIPENAEKPSDARKHKGENRELINQNVTIERIWAMPNKNTFDIKPIKELILDEYTEGLWIDPFANQNKIASITNDLNTDYDTDYHMDALDF